MTRTLFADDIAERPQAGAPTVHRDALYERYEDLIEVNPDLSRSLVSYQANKDEPFYRWFKYKEGFAARLIGYCLSCLGVKPGALLDPFAGSGAALFAAADLGWKAAGIELLPVGVRVVQARLAARDASVEAFRSAVHRVQKSRLEAFYDPAFAFPHIPITRGAFPPRTERQMAGYLALCEEQSDDPRTEELLRFACLCVLEEVSFTRKDGQYLRWDTRSPKKNAGRPFHKGRIPLFKEAIDNKLRDMLADMENRPPRPDRGRGGLVEVYEGSCLDRLPAMPAASVDVVVTSPPYCNRYDYTRTYALELAFLGRTNDQVKALRQAMLSCTVENREKAAELREMYARVGRGAFYSAVLRAFREQTALQEVLAALFGYRDQNRLNNSNVPRMVQNYFLEMALVIAEIARILRPGGCVVMVNDNVRYAGEEVPVDLILSDFAGRFGLRARHIWTLPRGKGNSSQQMGCHGRRELRKCVYVWEKPALPEPSIMEPRRRYRGR